MTKKSRVISATSTHSDGAVKQGSSESKVTNHQDDMLLIDPDEVGGGSTHSGETPKVKGAKKAPTTAAVRDEERPKGGRTAQIPNEVDPASGYLETEAGMPVIDNTVAAEVDDEVDTDEVEEVDPGDDVGDDEELEAEFEDLGDLEGEEGVEAEFDDGSDDGMDDLGAPDVEAEFEDLDELEAADEGAEEPLPFEEDVADAENVSLLDADAVSDEDADDLMFAVTANVVHVIRSNRIIASMGPATARKIQMHDVYLSDQFQDVVQASVDSKGLRKGLVQSGFVLAKVKLAAASKATTKAIEAKVSARITAKVEALNRKDEALEQSLAIAAVGINRRYFKDTPNELRAALETELQTAGVRGASRMVQAAFQAHGVDYAKAILTLARRLSAMPEEVRNQYAEALDLTSDEEFDVEAELDDEDDFDEDAEDMPTSVSAALLSPSRRSSPQTASLLKAGTNSAAMSILTGDTPLV